MKCVSAKDIAASWNINERSVRRYCEQGQYYQPKLTNHEAFYLRECGMPYLRFDWSAAVSSMPGHL